MLISLYTPCARSWGITDVCDAWPVRSQTYGYLSSRKASPPIGCYQIILLSDRGTCVYTTCPGLHLTARRLGIETQSAHRKCSTIGNRPRPSSHTLPESEKIELQYVISHPFPWRLVINLKSNLVGLVSHT